MLQQARSQFGMGEVAAKQEHAASLVQGRAQVLHSRHVGQAHQRPGRRVPGAQQLQRADGGGAQVGAQQLLALRRIEVGEAQRQVDLGIVPTTPRQWRQDDR